MMPGMIMLWFGSIASIPSGWHECNGEMGTPDLRGKYIPGASAIAPPGTIGGEFIHTHTFTGDGHYHELTPGDTIKLIPPEGTLCDCSDTKQATGTTDWALHVPPYHTLCYIMKL